MSEFGFAQYLENKKTEWDQIMYTHLSLTISTFGIVFFPKFVTELRPLIDIRIKPNIVYTLSLTRSKLGL